MGRFAALLASKKIAIARVVIKTRQHLAAIKPQEKGLMLELMHFADELRHVDEFKLPAAREVGKKELQMAQALIESMSEPWKPDAFEDEYRKALEAVIKEKIEKGEHAAPKPAHKMKPTNVIDLVSVLQKSLDASGKGRIASKKRAAHPKSHARPPHKKRA